MQQLTLEIQDKNGKVLAAKSDAKRVELFYHASFVQMRPIAFWCFS